MASSPRAGVPLAAPLLPMMCMNTEKLKLVHQYPTVREYMSASPVTIGAQRSLAAAEGVMREHGIRHLPALDGGQVVGLLSERDLAAGGVDAAGQPHRGAGRGGNGPQRLPGVPGRPGGGGRRDHRIDRKLGSAVVVERGEGGRRVHHHRRPPLAARPAERALRHAGVAYLGPRRRRICAFPVQRRPPMTPGWRWHGPCCYLSHERRGDGRTGAGRAAGGGRPSGAGPGAGELAGVAARGGGGGDPGSTARWTRSRR